MNPFQQIESKICDLNTIQKRLHQWRFKDDTIVFTNGCFDLLHAGHVSTIAQSAGYGDRLIIGLNSDSSVKKLKGEKRPLNNERNRALLLASMHFVDAVVVFDEETPESLISAIVPDVLVKGGDYKLEEVVGANIVLNNGGKVELAELLPNLSSTSLIEQITEK